jgi:hypothetical protein
VVSMGSAMLRSTPASFKTSSGSTTVSSCLVV